MKKVVFILSLGHTGSTLLGYFLGSHSLGLHIGEVIEPMRKKAPFLCYDCGDQPCPVWGGALDEAFVRRCIQATIRATQDANSLARSVRSLYGRMKGEFEPEGALFERVLADYEDIEFVVDGSKSIRWAEYNSRSTSFSSYFIFLVRDLRAVTASLRRAYKEPVAKTIREQVQALERIRSFLAARSPERVHKVRYEDLAQRPREIGEGACEFLGLPFEERMLEYYDAPNHVIGGNVGPNVQARNWRREDNQRLLQRVGDSYREYYGSSSPGFKLDERWRRELDADDLKEIENVAGELNRDLGYAD